MAIDTDLLFQIQIERLSRQRVMTTQWINAGIQTWAYLTMIDTFFTGAYKTYNQYFFYVVMGIVTLSCLVSLVVAIASSYRFHFKPGPLDHYLHDL